MWKNQGSWNFFHTKLIPNSSSIIKTAIEIKHLIFINDKNKTENLPHIGKISVDIR